MAEVTRSRQNRKTVELLDNVARLLGEHLFVQSEYCAPRHPPRTARLQLQASREECGTARDAAIQYQRRYAVYS